MKISVALIVKNEEKMLSRCLESVKDADEIVISDTGSKDKTVEIAKKYTDKVYTEFEWCDHFAKARNFAKSKCTGDWILSIDADEWLENNIDEVREVAKKAEEKGFRFVNVRNISDCKAQHLFFPFLFKNDPDIIWKGAAHNYLSTKSGEQKMPMASNLSISYGYSPAHLLDPNRTFRILSKKVKENPKLDRETYYLAREYFYRKKYKECIKYCKRYVKLSAFRAEKADAYLMMARCLWPLQRGNEAREACLQAIGINPNFKEALEFMSEMYYEPAKHRWASFAAIADNSHVLFVRNTEKPRDFVVGDDMRLKPLDENKLENMGEEPMSLTKDCLFFMENLLHRYRKVDVLEWGAGYSTRYFPKMLKEAGIEYTWKAMEHDKDWYERVKSWNVPGVELIHANVDSKEYLEPTGKFDVIYVDGRNRVECLKHAKKILKPGGYVLLHDAEREKYKPGLEGYHGVYIGGQETHPRYGSPLLWVGKLEPMKTIPKIIHQIWIGPKKRPEKWMDSWKEKNPGFEYKIWTEKEIEKLGLQNKKLYDKFMEDECYSGASDVARAEILLKEGGIYIDADTDCVTPLENAPFMAWDFLAIYASDLDSRLNNAPMGCIPGHPYMKKYVEAMKDVKQIHPPWLTVGRKLLEEVLTDHDSVLPGCSFAPEHHSGHLNKDIGLVYGRHYWGTTNELQTNRKIYDTIK